MKATTMMSWYRSYLSLLAFGVTINYEVQSSYLQSTDKRNNICDLGCPRNAPCRFGKADFSGRKDFLKTETDRNGMHCDCPIGWTGILCDKKYESCTNQNGHECYNGGECILGLQDKYGNEQLFCDCSNADGYVGKYCETPLEQKCWTNHNEDGYSFCVNGGECNPSFPESSSRPCICDDGWEGYHCEYKKNAVPECTLDCQNDSVCFVVATGNFERAVKDYRWSLDETETNMVCRCLPGFGGRLCEAPAEQCDNSSDHVCLYGGKCVTNTVQIPDGNVKSQHHCDCAMATNEKNDYFAGKYCEHKATSVCSNDELNFFCTQGGTCKSNLTEGCSCPNGTTGYKCEIILDSSSRDANGNLNEISLEGNGNSYDYNQDNYSTNHEQKTVPCADGYCRNGGYCVTEQMILQDGSYDIKEYCDCSRAYDANANYAGLYCQYKSTSLCFVENVLQDSLDETFCVNNGACQEDGTCKCPKGWTGQYCELKTSELSQKSVNEIDKDIDTGVVDIELDFDKCGEINCYNGGSCVQTEYLQSNGDLVLDTNCDCSTAFDRNYLYAGASCEFPSTQICSIPQGGQSVEGSTFCTNHGTCMVDIQLGCDCPAGFFGFACEYEIHENINHFNYTEEDEGPKWKICGHGVCHHGGKCITSIIYREEMDTSEISYRCDYSTAFDSDIAYIGPSCEDPSTKPKLEVCGEDQHFCLNGSKCIPNTDVDSGYSCDCSKADEVIGDNSEIHVFDGDSYHYADIDICTIGDEFPGQPLYFCVNGGSCNAWVMGDESDPGCICPDSFTGPHCEINIGPGKKHRSSSKTKYPPRKIAGVIAGSLLALLVVLVTVANYIRCRKTRKDRANTTKKSVPDKGNLFSPRRRRKAGTGISPNMKSPISNTDAPPSRDAEAETEINSRLINGNDGIMNVYRGVELPYCSDNPVLVENLLLDDESKPEDSHFV